MYSVDGLVFVGGVVVGGSLCVATGGVDGVFVLVSLKVNATTLLRDGTKDVEALRNAILFICRTDAVHFGEGGSYES